MAPVTIINGKLNFENIAEILGDMIHTLTDQTGDTLLSCKVYTVRLELELVYIYKYVYKHYSHVSQCINDLLSSA